MVTKLQILIYKIDMYINFVSDENKNFYVSFWLLLTILLVSLMIVIGGLTRLTDSGLSIVEWRPIMGTIPPITSQAWTEVFNKYKLTPEYQIVNFSMSIEEFKFIFWWEWFHRFLARFIGLIFLIPFIYYSLKKKLTRMQKKAYLCPRLYNAVFILMKMAILISICLSE